MKDDRVYLRYILECIRRIEEDIALGYDGFMSSHLHQDAVLRNLQVTCETTQRISDAIKSRYPAVEWETIAAFRNVLVHDYLGIDVERVWHIVTQNVPELRDRIQRILDDIGD
jgi:uncharacterized protein with HEPN domain